MTSLAEAQFVPALRLLNLRALPLVLAALALHACGTEADKPANDAASFAARIAKKEQAAPPSPPGGTPVAATPLPDASSYPSSEAALTDQAPSPCGAPLMAPFIGKLADQSTRADIAKALGRTDNLRFVGHSSDNVNPEPTHPRLSLILDAQNIIRDAHCG